MQRVRELRPRLVVFVVYGQNPNYGTTSMSGSTLLAQRMAPASTSSATFRDAAWQRYFSEPNYLALVERKFGVQERTNLEDMATIRLKRRLLGD